MQIGVVLVTYNRLEKLKTTLASFDKQTCSPDYIMIVNNASTDGTDQYLAEWKSVAKPYQKIVFTSKVNTGGSGGFYKGLSEALKLDADWIWVSDDDAYPYEDALEQASRFLDSYSGDKLAAICGEVLTDGKIDTGHRRNFIPHGLKLQALPVPESEYQKESFEINQFSYVGSVISKKAMESVGVTNKNYFIHYDDTEHSLRLSKYGKILCVPAIKINHDTATYVDLDAYAASWQKYYDYRNLMDMIREIYPKKYSDYQYFVYQSKIAFYKLFGMKKEQRDILAAAMEDYKHHKLGIHDVYRPGYKRI
jgi:GT2 family glycosyltransferase